MAKPLRVALIGIPNAGKTALFNRLTGSRHKVANYAGVTVERRSGWLTLESGRVIELIDLPGLYCLRPNTEDERIAYQVCTGQWPGESAPDVLVCVIDATNLRLHLRFALEVLQLGLPVIVALNQADQAHRLGIEIDSRGLSEALGVPVVETVAIRPDGARALVQELVRFSAEQAPAAYRPAADADLHAITRRLLAAHVRWPQQRRRLEDRLDRWLLHPVVGPVVLAAVLFLVFQAVYAGAAPVSDWIDAGVAALGEAAQAALPPGPLSNLIVNGAIPGAGSVLVFLPQILILFFFILLLDESGYLPRAAFLLDRIMASAGLSGRSFIPLLSSFACAIPGIMATRTIADPRERLVTIVVAPLMTCSARLPVYALLIGAFVPARTVGPGLQLQGLVLFGLYLLGIVSALLVARAIKRWRRDQDEHALLMELPAYRLPYWRNLAVGLGERAWIFLRRVGGIILALTVLLWFLLSYPAPAPEATGEAAVLQSFAGQLGRALAVLFEPLGFNWQISVALVPGLAAREVMVSSLATVYALAQPDGTDTGSVLLEVIRQQWSVATGLSLLVFYVYAPLCVATWAVIRRETNSWRITLATVAGLFALAYVAAWGTYRAAAWAGLT
ncbi:MAG: ferrous iron transporter B [Tepidimonas sp.]|uniref:ferrous iron transporter B n=1 Tax=Tepidimonas sp. TaxID=2002775 RepID=UPI004054B273